MAWDAGDKLTHARARTHTHMKWGMSHKIVGWGDLIMYRINIFMSNLPFVRLCACACACACVCACVCMCARTQVSALVASAHELRARCDDEAAEQRCMLQEEKQESQVAL